MAVSPIQKLLLAHVGLLNWQVLVLRGEADALFGPIESSFGINNNLAKPL